MLGSYTRVFTVHDNTKNGCLGDKEVGVGGGGEGCTHTNTLHGP